MTLDEDDQTFPTLLAGRRMRAWVWGAAICLAVLAGLAIPRPAPAQQAKSRLEHIQLLRKDKRARLWPERTPGLTKKILEFTDRGVLEGIRSRRGSNGFQLVLGGMRTGQGTTVGVGYRRIDLWGERVAFRATARGTPQLAFMFDFELRFPRLTGDRFDFFIYAKQENSPMVDYYGPGAGSAKGGRTSYRLEDYHVDAEGRFRIWRAFYAGGTGGYYRAHVGRGQRKGFPSTDERFGPADTPGIDRQGGFLRAGAFLQYDYRDNPYGPRSGGNYYSRYTRYWDQDLEQHTFNRLESAVEQYLPYRNKTRVLALRLAAVMTYAGKGQSVPFYLQPFLGGNEFLRGFARYRFYDQNSILFTAEHRWYVFSGMHAALFFEGGKVTPKASQLNFHELEYSGGIGFRFTVRDTVIMRIDNAVSREGYRLMWTFSNMW